jgi:hypothetical protein
MNIEETIHIDDQGNKRAEPAFRIETDADLTRLQNAAAAGKTANEIAAEFRSEGGTTAQNLNQKYAPRIFGEGRLCFESVDDMRAAARQIADTSDYKTSEDPRSETIVIYKVEESDLRSFGRILGADVQVWNYGEEGWLDIDDEQIGQDFDRGRMPDFSNSEVLNDEGTGLLTVYHGTGQDAKFGVFDSSRLGSKHGQPSAHFGFAFTKESGVAGSYGPRIYSVQLNLENPYYMSSEEFGIYETKWKDDPIIPELIERVKNRQAELIKKGYDGIEVGDDPDDVACWIAFSPDQIRILGSETALERTDLLRSSLLKTLESIRDTSDESKYYGLAPTLSKAALDAEEKLIEHKADLIVGQPVDVRVVELALRMIGGSVVLSSC